MIPLKDFMAAKTSIYQRSWAISPWQVMSWSLRQLGLVGSASAEDKLVVSSFVVMANVEVRPVPFPRYSTASRRHAGTS